MITLRKFHSQRERGGDMRYVVALFLAVCAAAPLLSQERAEGPANEKAQKTYQEALKNLNKHETDAAVGNFKKADKQDGGRCVGCQKNLIKYGVELGDWKTAEMAAEEMVAEAQAGKEAALAHYQFGVVLMNEALSKKKDEVYTRAHSELSEALAEAPNFPAADRKR